jgi:hypothetical protein
MIWPYTLGRCKERTPTLIDYWLPEGAFMLEHHSIGISAPPARAFAGTTGLPLRALPFVRALFSIRGIPYQMEMTLREMFLTKPFLVLEEEKDREIVFGIVGPFWSLRRGHLPSGIPRSPDDFRNALKEGRMAAIGNFRADPTSRASTHVWTETWAWSPKPVPTALFTFYWLVIGPWSALIRRMFLKADCRQTLHPANEALD